MDSIEIPFQVGWVRNTRGLDDQHIRLDVPGDIHQTFDKIGLDTDTENGSLADFQHVQVIIFDQRPVHPDITELVHEDHEFSIVRKSMNDPVEKGGLAASQKSADQIYCRLSGHGYLPLDPLL